MRKWMLQNGLGDVDGGDAGAGGVGEQGGTSGGAPGGTGGDTNTGTGGDTGDFVGPAWAKDLKLTVEKEILQDPALGPISDVNSLVKSYVHAQRKIGQKGVLIPSENSTKEEWDTFYQKIGVPLEEQKYKESLKVDGFDEELNANYIKMAHELRISPKAAEKLHKFFVDKTKESTEKFVNATKEKMDSELLALQEKMGTDAYQVKLAKANKYLAENAGKEFLSYLKESGMGRNAKIVEAFINLADKAMAEDELPSGAGKQSMTKDDYNREINQVMGNFDDPYHKPNHPDHSRRVNEVLGWFNKLDRK